MKISFLLVSLCVIAFFAAPVESQAGSIGNFCGYYSGLLKISNNLLITTVVNQTIFQYIVPGPLVIFFNGVKNNSLNNFSFIANATAFGNLFTHLVQFFGAALNCTDGTIAAYGGKTMIVAHAGLQIDYQQFALFNQYVLNVLANNGVYASDVILVAKLLNSLNTQTCFYTDCQNICNKYSVQGVLNNTALVTTVVVNTFMAAIAAPGLVNFFNGQITYPGVTNYLTNTTAQGILVAHLVEFFGIALGCTDGTIGAYQGVSLSASHVILPIGGAAFSAFNTALLGVLTSLGVSAADVATVGTVLESTRAQVCSLPDCFYTTIPAATSAVPVTTKAADASSMGPAVAMLAGAFAANRLF